MLRFRVSSLLLFVLMIAIALGWFVDRRNLIDRFERENPRISRWNFKFHYWSPSLYLHDRDTSHYESLLAERIEFDGKFVVSSQGMGSPRLRQPTNETLDATIALLDDSNESTKLQAAELLALYLQAVCGSANVDGDSLATRVHFQVAGLRKTRGLLESDNSEIRNAAALILGNTIYDRCTVEILSDAFNKESDPDVFVHLAWAYWKIGHNYDNAEFWQSKAGATLNRTPAAEQSDNEKDPE
jgi:hypothetical protein